jgi:hypothetical protein
VVAPKERESFDGRRTKERVMTTQKLFKRRVRARMMKTGERYTAARRHVAAQRGRQDLPARPEAPDLSSALELASEAKVLGATGRGWLEWIRDLDAWGARDRTHTETAAYLVETHAVPGWYAQAITNGYERVTGLRAKHQQADGYTVYASKTVDVAVDVLYHAFVDERTRRRWLTDGVLSPRTSRPNRVARFDWDGGTTRVMVTFEAKGPSKATASVSHERLPDPEAGAAAKAAWRERLVVLKSVLEAGR